MTHRETAEEILKHPRPMLADLITAALAAQQAETREDDETRCTVCRMEYPRTGQQTGPIWEIVGKGFRVCRRCRGAGLDAKRRALSPTPEPTKEG